MSRRYFDMRAENELAKYLDKNLYGELLHKKEISFFQRIYDSNLQKQGVDIKLEHQGHTLLIDEKAQLYYINKGIPTFAFELEFLLNGKPYCGWFLNDHLKTTHYLLMWPYATETQLSKVTQDSFTRIDALLLSKKKLRSYLWDIGLDVLTLTNAAQAVRRRGTSGPYRIPQDGMKLYLSDYSKYSEAPINLVIQKKLLYQLADKVFTCPLSHIN